MKQLCAIFFTVSIVLLSIATAQKSLRTPSADEILSKVVTGFLTVRDFSVTVDVEIQMERVQIPKMKAMMYFKKPDKVHFSSQRFLLLPREGLALNPSTLQEHYRTQSLVHDTLDGKKVFKLFLTAKDSKTRLRELNIWVDPLTWTIAKVETIPYEGRNLSMVFSYQLVQEKYWLPAKLLLQYKTESDQAIMDSSRTSDQPYDVPQRAAPRNGAMTILYSGYIVNTNIPDDVFEKKEKQ
jgi:outer membrane lipoprotein-sorting protein